MGRRRRKVIRIPKKRLPTVFFCPKCGQKTLRVNIDQLASQVRVECGWCGERITRGLGKSGTIIPCPTCRSPLVKISITDGMTRARITCERCGKPNVLEITDSWAKLGCFCPPSKQSRFLIHIGGRMATINCGYCGLNVYFNVKGVEEKIDVYHRFFDAYYKGRYRGVPLWRER